jgi:putative DNA methylase
LVTGGAPACWRSRGYLPHLDGPNLVQHVVFRLADSLPGGLRTELSRAGSGDRVVAIDAALDQGHGRRDLATPAVAELVQSALFTFDADRYALIAWCVMPNHVHALLTLCPEYRLDRIVHSWKSYTAKEANRLLRRSGAFWAREYFDRFMRDSDHLVRTVAYIEGNPVKAGLCESVSDWRFSSTWGGWGRRDAGGPTTGQRDAGGPTTGQRDAGGPTTGRRDAGAPDFR